MPSVVVQEYSGDLGAEPTMGSRGRAHTQRVPPEAEALLVFGRLMEAANLPSFLKFGNTKISDICVIFTKKTWVAMKLGGLEQNWEACVPPDPGLKQPLTKTDN